MKKAGTILLISAFFLTFMITKSINVMAKVYKIHLPEYRVWINMRVRCYKVGSQAYHNYGARGVTVSDSWNKSFEAFYADMGPRPKGGSLDRIDNDKGYSKENCRWVSMRDNSNNKRTNVFYEYDGQRLTMAQWAYKHGMSNDTLWRRLNKYKMDISEALTRPLLKKHDFIIDGEHLTLPQAAERTGLTVITIRCRLKRGWSKDKILSTPILRGKNKKA